MGMSIHYFLLVAFMWMFIDGYQLYRIVNNFFNVWTIKMTVFYVILGYTVPLLTLMLTALAASFIQGNVLMVYNGNQSDGAGCADSKEYKAQSFNFSTSLIKFAN